MLRAPTSVYPKAKPGFHLKRHALKNCWFDGRIILIRSEYVECKKIFFMNMVRFFVVLAATGYPTLMRSTQYSLFTEFHCFQTAGIE